MAESRLPNAFGDFVAPFALSTDAGEISPRRLALLGAIGETGSISAAARLVGITYKAAWDAVEAMNNLAGDALVQTQHGGRGGGGAELTPAGHKIVADLARLEVLQAQFMTQLRREGDLDRSLALMKRISMKSSARNALTGTVESVTKGAVNAEVGLRLRGGDPLHAVITLESLQELDLAPGREVLALIKASWIILTMGGEWQRSSARNRLCGQVQRIVPGEISAEVVYTLAGGSTIAATITRQSLTALDIVVGDQVCGLVKASHIILGVNS